MSCHHKKCVAELQRQLKEQHGAPVAIHRGSSPSHVTREKGYRKKSAVLDLTSFNQILSIEADTAIVEPGVTMEQLVKATLCQGLIPLVVPEFRQITVGGALVGGALESSSHQHGAFADSCLWCEIMLGNGDTITTSPTQHADLFHALPGSYGTLGIVTLLALRLIPAKQSVSIHYAVCSLDQALARLSTNHAPFVDGMILARDRCVVMEGEMTNTPPTLNLRARHAPWFYQRVYQQMDRGAGTDSLAIQDYLFRFDRGAFWMGQFILQPVSLLAYLFRLRVLRGRATQRIRNSVYPRFPSWWFRWLFARRASSQQLYRGWHLMPKEMKRDLLLVQDVSIPLTAAASFLQGIDYGIYPVWLCPVRQPTAPQLFSQYSLPSKDHALNIGIYGVPSIDATSATQELEQRALGIGGRLGLYSQCYLSEADFWAHYDRDAYMKLRHTYCATEAFLDITSKILMPHVRDL